LYKNLYIILYIFIYKIAQTGTGKQNAGCGVRNAEFWRSGGTSRRGGTCKFEDFGRHFRPDRESRFNHEGTKESLSFPRRREPIHWKQKTIILEGMKTNRATVAPTNRSGELCNECDLPVAWGSGRFVNRVPDLNDVEVRCDMGKPYPAGDYLCEECDLNLVLEYE